MISLAHFDDAARLALVEARRRSMLQHRPTITSRDILSALVDRDEIDELLRRAGIPPAAVIERLGGAPPSPAQLLGELGIDLGAVRSALPAVAHNAASARWRMRRSRTRPLRITLDGPSSRTSFDRRGRKVLEVALWAGRRNAQTAGPTHLLFGVLADGADPVLDVLTASGPAPFERLLLELDRRGLPTATSTRH